MTTDELFLFTLDDLEGRLDLAHGEYDVLMAAALLRKLLLGGERSLVNLVANTRGATVEFIVNDEPLASTIQLAFPDVVEPRQGTQTVTVDVNGLLRCIAGRTWVGAEIDREIVDITVKDLIHFLANEEGAVHRGRGPLPEKKYKVFDQLKQVRRFGPEWQYSGAVHGCLVIGRIVIDGLAELRAQVMRETWPKDHDERLRGLEGRGVLRHDDGSTSVVEQGGQVVQVRMTPPEPPAFRAEP